ncbi:MAG TPA: aldehyde dehydrogenase family protein [Chloroflexi bacterium]|nr:MAG: acetaldehyde dehydrogenase [Chloroflexota bacterium]HDD55435.1 aldehyde dehydrogenase family protein [Chloroflexota bacterium]
MPEFDKDLRSIQQARRMMVSAREAQKVWGFATQAEVDRVCEAMAKAAYGAAERLGRMAAEETGFGVPEHKKIKNQFASQAVWEEIKDVKTVGIIKKDEVKKLYQIAWPMGVIAALTPSTNPTSTVINKILMAIKARNAIVIAPHPSAVNCCVETAKLMDKAAVEAGAPEGLIHCMSEVTLPGTDELLSHKYTALILATGGSGMVRVAHSKGKPAYGVGPGNVPVYVDRSADLEKAARYIVNSKAFDYSLICATEQSVVADRPIAARLKELMQAQGAYWVSPAEAEALRPILFFPNGAIDASAVGKSPQFLAAKAGFQIPEGTRILVADLQHVGKEEPLSREKLTPVLGFFIEDGWEAGCERCLELINFGGRGHSLIIHATNEDIIYAFGLEKPVFRIGVNTMGTLGMIGYTTGISPSLTLGSGGVGGAITGDNIDVHHLYNVKRMAFEIRQPPLEAFQPGRVPAGSAQAPDYQALEKLVQDTVMEILGKK